MPEDSRSSTISGMVRVAVSNSKPIPLTLTLSHGEREQPAAGSVVREVRRADTALGALKASGGFSLSPRERAGVRGKVTLAVRTALALARKSADRPKGRMALSYSFFHASGFAGGH